MMTVILPIMMIIAPIRQGQTGTFPSWVIGEGTSFGVLASELEKSWILASPTPMPGVQPGLPVPYPLPSCQLHPVVSHPWAR